MMVALSPLLALRITVPWKRKSLRETRKLTHGWSVSTRLGVFQRVVYAWATVWFETGAMTSAKWYDNGYDPPLTWPVQRIKASKGEKASNKISPMITRHLVFVKCEAFRLLLTRQWSVGWCPALLMRSEDLVNSSEGNVFFSLENAVSSCI